MNNWRAGNVNYKEWFDDIYGNNSNYPTFTVGNAPGLYFTPNPLAMGDRPIGVKMHAETITLSNIGSTPVEISNVDFSGSGFFILDTESENPELPLILEDGGEVTFHINTNPDATISAGDVNDSFVAIWANRNVSLSTITATAYEPIAPDVVEHPVTVTNFPYTTTQSTISLHDNYYLPGTNVDATDGVYKIIIDTDMAFNAEVVEGNNAKIALYKENFNGGFGPDSTNFYSGIEIGSGSSNSVLFDQSEMITHPGAGFNGADVSVVCAGGIEYGVNCNWAMASGDWYLVADDFTLEDDSNISEMEFYAFQVGSTTESTMTGLYIQILDDSPLNGGQVVWGDNTTNLLSYTEWTNIYRSSEGSMLETARPIMKVVATGLDIDIEAGNYWITVGITGSLTSGPWAVPRSIWSEANTGNGLQKNSTGWINWYDNGSKGLPMILRTGNMYRDTSVAQQQQPNIDVESAPAADVMSAEEIAMRPVMSEEYPVSYGGNDPITNLTVTPGVYYLVASSTSAQYILNINPQTIPVPMDPTVIYPADGQSNIEARPTLRWNLGQFTTEYQLLVGTTYPPTHIVKDWSSDLVDSYSLSTLLNNKNYFWRVNERNASGTTNGPIWGFTTILNIPQTLAAADINLYEGDNAVLSWSSVNDRSIRGYNIYQDGVKINENVITATTYSVSGLAYNMNGYTFNVTAVYDEGESDYSNNVVVYVSGNGTVSGVVYEQDSLTIIEGATVIFSGEDEYGVEQSFTFITDSNGAYNGSILAGIYNANATKDGYQSNVYEEEVEINYAANTADINFVMNENYVPVGMVVAEEINDNMVKVYWKWDDIVPMSEWLYYDDGTNVNAVGITAGGSFYWGIMFPAATLQQYGSFSLTKVAYFDYSAHTGNILIYEGGSTAPGTLIHQQPYTATGSSEFVEYDLNNAIPINTNENLWIVMNNNDGQYVAAASSNTGDANGRWISLDGATWQDIDELGHSYTWNLRGFITNQLGNVIALANDKGNTPVIYEGKSTPDGVLTNDPSAKITATNFGNNKVNDRSFQYYKLYRTDCYNEEYTVVNTQIIAYNIIDTVFTDMSWAGTEAGVYKWGVSANYSGNRNEINASETVWSNCVDKDMTTTLDVAVITNSNDAPTGTSVHFVNISEPEMFISYEVELDETGIYTWEDVRKGTYVYSISLAGFTACAHNDTIEIWDATSIECELVENVTAVSNLYVSPTGWAMWNRNGNTLGNGDEFYYDFENGTLNGWTTIDADGDGYNWSNSATCTYLSIPAYNGSIGCAISESYTNQTNTPLTPDNYLVRSEKVNIGSNSRLGFYVSALDASYPAEHYGVAISTESNTDPNDFTVIWEETLIAKSNTNAPRGTNDQGEWYYKEIDLSAYSGQQVYIAIRHWDVYDQFVITIDNVSLFNSRNTESIDSYTVLLDGIYIDNVENTYYQHEVTNLVEGEEYTTSVAAIYSTGFSEWTDYTWTYAGCENYESVESVNAEMVDNNVLVSWNGMPSGLKANLDDTWLHYDDGINEQAIGMQTTAPFYWGIMFPASTLSSYENYEISKISMFDYTAHSGRIMIYQGGETAPQTLVYQQLYESGGSNEYINYELNESIPLDITQNLWIVLYNFNGQYVAAAGANTGDANGRWISADGTTWGDIVVLSEGQLNCTWNLRAMIKSTNTSEYGILGTTVFRDGKLLTPTPITQNNFTDTHPENGEHEYCVRVVYGGEEYDTNWYSMSCPICSSLNLDCAAPESLAGSYTWNEEEFGATLTWNSTMTPDHFVIYRSSSNGNYQELAQVSGNVNTYFDNCTGNADEYFYQVTAVYANGCESAPALAAQNPEEDYVMVNITSINENDMNALLIYPNPTKDVINIVSDGMKRITITTMIGQILYDQAVESDNAIVDMKRYENGVYIVRIVNKNGIIVKQVSLIN